MPYPSAPELLVLHGLRLKGFGEAAAIAELVGLDESDVAKHLEALRDADLVLHREGRLAGWALTAAGREEQERRLAEERDAHDAGPVIESAYRRFLALNQSFLEACTAWQMKGDALNDHADQAYDAACVARLAALHCDLKPILTDLEALFDRYHGYRLRLEAALAKLQDGEQDWFTKPMIDSYHTIWFQLHEDLLNTLGIERSQESTEEVA